MKPLSGLSYEIILQNIVDLIYVRHPKAAQNKNEATPSWIIDYFSSIITKDSTQFFESLLTIPTLSNAFGGDILSPRMQIWWRQTKPSKGKENECRQGKSFELQDHIQEITDKIPDDQSGVCLNEPAQLRPINETKLENVIKSLPSGPTCSTKSRDTAARDSSLYTSRNRKRQLLDNSVFEDAPWATHAHFDEDWITKIKRHQDDILPTAEIEENRHWFKYLYNSQEPKKSR